MQSVKVNITINVKAAGGNLVVDTSGVPTEAEVGTPYSGALSVSGGVAPYAFSLSSGSLPDGVSLMSDGSLSGTPTVAGAFAFEVEVKDSSL